MIGALIFGLFVPGPAIAIGIAVLFRAIADRRCARLCALYWEIQRLEQRNRELEARAKRMEKVRRKARLARSQLVFESWRAAA